jgi:hypothetical protein
MHIAKGRGTCQRIRQISNIDAESHLLCVQSELADLELVLTNYIFDRYSSITSYTFTAAPKQIFDEIFVEW